MNTADRSGAANYLVQHVFAFERTGLVSRWQTVERFVEPCSLLISKHAAVRLPSASVVHLLPCAGTEGGVDGRSAVVPCMAPMEAASSQKSSVLCHFLLRPLPNIHSVSRGAGIGGSSNWTPGESPRALQEVNLTQETHFTCTVPQRLTGVVVFTDDRVNGEGAQATALLETMKGAVSENYLPDASSKRTQEPS